MVLMGNESQSWVGRREEWKNFTRSGDLNLRSTPAPKILSHLPIHE